MRVFLLLIVLLLVAGLVLYLRPEYRDRIQDLSSDIGLSRITSKKTAHLFKWRDARGNWQITDQLPPKGVDYEKLEYREDVNVLPRPPGLQQQ
ncbi:MAG: DUF4124 domain-containing protein [Gammaproteobacteria bacterium]